MRVSSKPGLWLLVPRTLNYFANANKAMGQSHEVSGLFWS
jgi:hypothetical protein